MSTDADTGTKARDNTEWWNNGLNTIAVLAVIPEPFDAYDLSKIIGEPWHANHWGSLFAAAKKHGTIQPYDFHPSPRPTRSGGVCRRWIGRRP